MEAIDWWLGLIQKYKVQYLFIVPNHGTAFLSYEPNRERRDFLPLIHSHSYRLIAKRPKYKSHSLQQYGVSPNTIISLSFLNRMRLAQTRLDCDQDLGRIGESTSRSRRCAHCGEPQHSG